MANPYKFTERIEGIDFYFLIAKNLDKMSDILKSGLEPGGIPNGEKLLAFYMSTKFYENMITMFLKEDYWRKKEELFAKIPVIDKAFGDAKSNIDFFNRVSEWFQLIHINAYNEGILKIQRPIRPDKKGPVYKNGFKPDYDKPTQV